MRNRTAPVPAVALLCIASAAAAAPDGIVPVPDYAAAEAQSFSLRPYLTGDWGGSRTMLAESGVTLNLNWAQLVQGVVQGGRDESTRYGGRLQALVNFDLDRMGAVPGGLVTLKVESRHGNSVNREAGTLLPVADLMYFPITEEADEDIAAAVTELLYTQLLSKELALFAGKFTVLGADANEFAEGDGGTQFLGHPFTSASVTSLFNPYSTLGAGVLVMPTPDWSITSSLYASHDSSTTTGLDTLDEGLVWSTALAWQYRLGELPGGLRVNYQHAFDRNFVDLAGRFITPGGVAIPTEGDSWCAFANMWQYLFVAEAPTGPINITNGRTDLRGFGIFARAGFADPDTNPIEWIVSGGIGAKGVIPGRDRDAMGIGYAYSQTSELPLVTTLLVNDHANRFEAYYSVAITPAAELTLDLQLADSLLARDETATVLGMRLRLEF
jgi:porin